MLGLDAFVERVAAELEIAPSDLLSTSFEGLGFDSLQYFELDLIVEELGAFVSDEDLAQVEDISDLHSAYCRAWRPAPDPGLAGD